MPKASDKPAADTGDLASSGHDTPSEEHDKAGTEREIGGRDGPDPTRYGDWEKAGRCIDF